MKTNLLTILIPIYNEEECLLALYQRLQHVGYRVNCDMDLALF